MRESHNSIDENIDFEGKNLTLVIHIIYFLHLLIK